MTTTLTTVAVDRTHVAHVVIGCTTTGTASSYPFTKHPAADAADLLVVVATGVFSVSVFNLEQSDDNGATWQTAVTGWDAVASPGFNFQLAEGVLYRFNCTSFTGTSVSVNASTTGEDILLTQQFAGNEIFASPDGATGFLSPRAMVVNDIPFVLPANKVPAQNVLKVETFLSAGQVNALLGSPQQIAPSPGANFMIRPLSVGVTYHGLGNTPYDTLGAGNLALFYGTNNGFGGAPMTLNKAILAQTDDEIGFFDLSAFANFDTHMNTESLALILSQLGPGEYTTGTAPVQIEVLYVIVPVH